MEIYKIVIVDLKTRVNIKTFVEVDEAESSENITIKMVINSYEVISSDYNYFSAYQDFRDKLLELGYGIKCNGSKINSVQSNMMNATNKIYFIKIDEVVKSKDIVNIWDYIDIDDFPNTKQQFDFFQKWSK